MQSAWEGERDSFEVTEGTKKEKIDDAFMGVISTGGVVTYGIV